jgi:hypothetical protein
MFGLGPEHEIETIKRVYDLYIDQKKTMIEIADNLNQQGILNAGGRCWNNMAVRQLLTNEKYTGSCIYNRGSKKLGGKWKRNPRSEWIRATGAFEAIVPFERFLAAQRQHKENASRYTNNVMLDFLTAILCRHGSLSRKLVDESNVAPSSNAYKEHFGSLSNAFGRVGFTTDRTRDRQRGQNLRKSICEEIATHVPAHGGFVRMISRSCQMRINEEFTVTVVLGRTSPSQQSHGQNQWRFGYRSQRKPDILIVARIDPGSSCTRDYFVLPFSFLPGGSWLTVSGINYLRLEGFRSDSLAPFYELCARIPLGHA